MKKLVGTIAALASLVQIAQAQEIVQAPYGVDGTWNIYELSEDQLTWAEALADARSRTREGVTGDLASIHSLEENQVVSDLAFNAITWIGATDREGAAPLVEQNGYLSPQESIQLEEEELLGDDRPGAGNVEAAVLAGWAWTSGDPFCFHNWPVGAEPNNWDGAGPGEAEIGFEDATFLRADLLWNDAPSGYAEDEPVVATLQPGTSTEELDGLPNDRFYDYVIEYNTNSPTPFPDIEQVGEEAVLEDGCGPIHPVDPDPLAPLDDGTLVDPTERANYVHDVLGTWVGDSNLDGEFNSADFVAVFTGGEYEDGVEGNSSWVTGDWTGNKEFDSGDFVAAFTDGGYENGPRGATASVPEPTSALLMLLGLLSLGLSRRK